MEIWEPFIAGFRKKGSTVQDYVLALYELAVLVHAQEKLKEFERHFAETKQMAMVKEYSQIYGIVMELLDKMVKVLGEETVSTREFKELLEAGLSEAKVGIIPPSTDQIVVGDMERTRLKDIKVLFFVGMNDGKIPKEETGGKILSDLNREELKGSSVTLAPTAKENLYTQRFYLYLNMTKPSDALYLSYSGMSASGEAMSPSYLIGGVKKLFPGLAITDGGETKELFLESPESALSVLTEQLRVILQEEPDEKWKELYAWYFGNEEWKTRLAHLLKAAFYRNPQDKIGKATAQALYGTTLENSATRLELFAKCACAHFLSYGLLLKERAKYEFNAMDMGNVLHSSLEQFAKENAGGKERLAAFGRRGADTAGRCMRR